MCGNAEHGFEIDRRLTEHEVEMQAIWSTIGREGGNVDYGVEIQELMKAHKQLEAKFENFIDYVLDFRKEYDDNG